LLNHHLGLPGSIVPGGSQSGQKLGKFEGKISQHKEILGLLSGDVLRWAEALMGPGNLDISVLSAQVAMRFPELPLDECHGLQTDNSIWHTDGFRQGCTHGFSLLLGVCLSDVFEENSGNLCVWPGSHRLIHSCKLRDRGQIDFIKLSTMLEKHEITDVTTVTSDIESKDDKSSSLSLSHSNSLPDLGQPIQILANAGVGKRTCKITPIISSNIFLNFDFFQ
jgi:hypothetical protein